MDPRKINLPGYEITGMLGRGGMGDIYRARQVSLNRVVALKVLPPELCRNDEFAGRFESEAKAISLLEHHNIVTIYDFGVNDELRYFAIQYIDGESLDKTLEREKRISLKDSIHYTRQILRALKYAHERNIIHRDIKPQNILLDQKGRLYVTDFGIAKMFTRTRLTQTGMTVGTPEYMSPEQSEGLELNPQTDLYSLGIVMHEILTGFPPFTADTPLAIAYKQVHEYPRPVHEIDPKIPKEIGLVILKALKKERKERYGSAEEMLNDLDHACELIEDSPGGSPNTSVKNEIADKRITDRRMGDRRTIQRRGFRRKDFKKYFIIAIVLLAAVIALLTLNLIYTLK